MYKYDDDDEEEEIETTTEEDVDGYEIFEETTDKETNDKK